MDAADTKKRKEFTRDEVANSASYEECIIIVDEKVYNVTSFLGRHPGGEDIILEWLGRDATSAFEGKGHSEQAYQMLKEFQIGIVVESASY